MNVLENYEQHSMGPLFPTTSNIATTQILQNCALQIRTDVVTPIRSRDINEWRRCSKSVNGDSETVQKWKAEWYSFQHKTTWSANLKWQFGNDRFFFHENFLNGSYFRVLDFRLTHFWSPPRRVTQKFHWILDSPTKLLSLVINITMFGFHLQYVVPINFPVKILAVRFTGLDPPRRLITWNSAPVLGMNQYEYLAVLWYLIPTFYRTSSHFSDLNPSSSTSPSTSSTLKGWLVTQRPVKIYLHQLWRRRQWRIHNVRRRWRD